MKRENAVLKLYKARLRMAVVNNILETIELTCSLVSNMEEIASSKIKHRAAFMNLLFILTIRCERLFEEVLLFLHNIADAQDFVAGNKTIEWIELAESKRKQLLKAQEALQKHRIIEGVEILKSAANGVKEFEKSIEEELLNQAKRLNKKKAN